MSVTIVPSQVKKAGGVADDVSLTVGSAGGDIDDAEACCASAQVGEFDTSGSLGDLFGVWLPKARGFRGCLEIVGEKLVTSASTYSKSDDDAASEFEYTDGYAKTR